MNILDENVPEGQRASLRRKRIAVRQIGEDIGRKGMKDREIVTLLHQLNRPTFFTFDGDFYDDHLCHAGYCLVHLDVEDDLAAEYIRRLLRHRELNTKTKRMGHVISVAPGGMKVWRLGEENEDALCWP